jgi:dipeptidase E
MRLFLSGGGTKASDLERRFSGALDHKKTLVYIPVAMNTKRHTYEECYTWFKNFIAPSYSGEIRMLTNLREFSGFDLDSIGGLFIGGGNTFKLLKIIRESRFDKYVNKLLANNVPLCGGSAGAVIFGRTIKLALGIDPNNVRLRNFSSFNQLGGYDLRPHYDLSLDDRIRKAMAKYSVSKALAVQEDAGVYVDKSGIEVIGKPLYVFDKTGKIKVEVGNVI